MHGLYIQGRNKVMGEKYAKDIDGCDDCPIYGNSCSGGCEGIPGGYKEPPCASWDEDTLVYEEMYDNNND